MRLEFNWSDKFVLGIKEIDDQHMELINRVNKLIIANNDDENKETIKKLLTFLKNYVVEHFASEEELQQKYNYPNYDEHRIEHFEFVKKIVDFENQYIKELDTKSPDNTKHLLYKMNGELVNWLSMHIDGSDRKIAEYIFHKK